MFFHHEEHEAHEEGTEVNKKESMWTRSNEFLTCTWKNCAARRS